MASPFTTYKLIILYMLQNSEGDLTNSQITDFILDRKYTNYFQPSRQFPNLWRQIWWKCLHSPTAVTID